MTGVKNHSTLADTSAQRGETLAASVLPFVAERHDGAAANHADGDQQRGADPERDGAGDNGRGALDIVVGSVFLQMRKARPDRDRPQRRTEKPHGSSLHESLHYGTFDILVARGAFGASFLKVQRP